MERKSIFVVVPTKIWILDVHFILSKKTTTMNWGEMTNKMTNVCGWLCVWKRRKWMMRGKYCGGFLLSTNYKIYMILFTPAAAAIVSFQSNLCSTLGWLCHLALVLLPAAMEVLLRLIVRTSASAIEARDNRQIGGLVIGQCDVTIEFKLWDADLQLLVGAGLFIVLKIFLN